jgi:hypothetical protein
MITIDDFLTIWKWLPENQPFNPKLIYSSTKNGRDFKSIHQCCDGKKNTISLFKVQFDGADQPCVIGGFLDAPWNSSNHWIQSEKAFIFSLTSNVKCNIADTQHAADGYSSYGPRFGGGADIFIPNNGKGYVNPSSYTGTAQLVLSKNYPGNGQIDFQTFEVEVYAID